jgi:hypothetical protein
LQIAGLEILDESGQARQFQAQLDDINNDIGSAAKGDLQSLLRDDQSHHSDATSLPNLLRRLDASGWHARKQGDR